MTRAIGISVVVPTRNRAELVVRAVESVLGQSRAADEVIVVDDGSTDDTVRRLARFAGRVQVVSQQSAGAAAARNNGVARAAHPWIAFLDSDDLWQREHLAAADAAIAATGGACALYFGDVRPSGGGPTWWDSSGFRVAGPFEVAADPMSWAMLPLQPMAVPSSVFHRDRMLAAGGFAALPVREDTYLYFLLCLQWSVCAVAGAGAIVTDDAGGARLTASHAAESLVYRECSVRMYSEVLRAARARRSPHASALRGRLSTAHWRLAGALWRSGDRWRATGEVARAAAWAPVATAASVFAMASRARRAPCR